MKKTTSLKWKISIYLLVFSVFLIAMTYIFQTILLQPMFEQSKITTLKKANDEIVEEMHNGDEDLFEVIYEASIEYDVCIRVFGEEMDVVVGNMGCTLYRMNEFDILKEVSLARENENENLTRKTGKIRQNKDDFIDITYTRITNYKDKQVAILTNASITPVNATTETLRQQLWFYALFALLGVLILVYLMNKYIAKPLSRMNEAAKELPLGVYGLTNKKPDYQEVDELNETLSRAAVDIKKADEMKRELIANVSHDLRTPLTMISGYGEMMKDLPGEKTDENCQVIIDESKRLTNLVNDLLDLSKFESDNYELQYKVFNLSELITHEAKKYDVYQVRDGFQFTYEIEGDLFVNADEERIAQVFNNYMINAVHYSTENKVIEVRLFKKDDVARCEVEDHGEGIATDKIADIWDRYYKIDRQHVRSISGSGIGLSIVKGIMDLHKANYGVTSELNKGSTFYFELPIVSKEEK